jgi:hypothetical protein
VAPRTITIVPGLITLGLDIDVGLAVGGFGLHGDNCRGRIGEGGGGEGRKKAIEERRKLTAKHPDGHSRGECRRGTEKKLEDNIEKQEPTVWRGPLSFM